MTVEARQPGVQGDSKPKTGYAALIKVLVVDRSEFLRAGLRRSLEAQPDMEVVGAFGEVAPAIAELDRLDPRVVLLSVTMPEMSGFEACKEVLARAPGSRVIMLS